MIPKKIHYCWFSSEPYPPMVTKCIDSWKQYMPDWEYVLWDYEKIKDIDSVWLKECLAVKKWAFAADFIRLWAIYAEGGIYLDTDVMLFGSLEEFLYDRCFIGRESCFYTTFDCGIQVFLTSHCFGSEPGHPFLCRNLAYYQDRHFIQSSSEHVPNILRYDMLMMPCIQSRIAEDYGYNPRFKADHLQRLEEGLTVYPSQYFGKNGRYPRKETGVYAWHLGCASWRESEYILSFSNHTVPFYYKIGWRLARVLNPIFSRFGFMLISIDRI